MPGVAESGSETRQRILEDPAPLALAAVGGLAKAKPQLRFAKESVKGAIDAKTGRAISEQIVRGPEARALEVPKVEVEQPTLPEKIATAAEPSKAARGKKVLNGTTVKEFSRSELEKIAQRDSPEGTIAKIELSIRGIGRAQEKLKFEREKLPEKGKVVPKAGKQAWEMNVKLNTEGSKYEYRVDWFGKKHGEWQRLYSEKGFSNKSEATKFANERQKQSIKQALSEGKPVPESVLADYPDLKPPAKEIPGIPKTKTDAFLEGLDKAEAGQDRSMNYPMQ